MVAIPQPERTTASEIYRSLAEAQGDGFRPHLGASLIGGPCARALWYTFRWATKVRHSGRTLRLFRRGQNEETDLARDLRRAGIEVWTVDPSTGKQWQFSDVGGHVGGSIDGCVRGIPEARKTYHVLEAKTHNDKSFRDLEKNGLEKSKPEHYAQCILYMHWAGMRRTLYAAVNKNDDQIYVERVRYNAAKAKTLVSKAARVVRAPVPLERISEKPEFYLCKWCSYRHVCHEGGIPEVNCRTCTHSTPVEDGHGGWICELHRRPLGIEAQKKGCAHHVFIPGLLPWQFREGNPVKNVAVYDAASGEIIQNGTAAPGVLTSKEIRERYGKAS